MAFPCASSLKIFPLSSVLSLFSSSNWCHLLFFITSSICSQDSFWKAFQTHEKLFQLLPPFISILCSGRRLWWWWYQWQLQLDEAVMLFNDREYYKCHDYLEALWNMAQEPTKTLIHGILQCAVGFHHLFNQVGTSFVGLALLIYWFILFTSFFFKILLLGFWWLVVN